jgi:hypothetical protein
MLFDAAPLLALSFDPCLLCQRPAHLPPDFILRRGRTSLYLAALYPIPSFLLFGIWHAASKCKSPGNFTEASKFRVTPSPTHARRLSKERPRRYILLETFYQLRFSTHNCIV